VDNIEELAMVTCKDHEHPLVKLTLKKSVKESEESKLYAGLLARAIERNTQLQFSPMTLPSLPGTFNDPLQQYARTINPLAQQQGKNCTMVPTPHCYVVVVGGTPNKNGGYDNATTELRCEWVMKEVCW
jgi:hypothetical protein